MKKIPASLGLLIIGSTLLASCSSGTDSSNIIDSGSSNRETIQSRKTNSFSRKANTDNEVSIEYDTRSRAS